MIAASAPGKVILFGEHAVVYGRPAIAVPVTEVMARVTLIEEGRGVCIHIPEQGAVYRFDDLDPNHPLAAIIRGTFEVLQISLPNNLTLTITSTIPIAGGLGSGAAVSTAIVRALAAYANHDLDNATVSRLVYQVEKIHHGTPSGIDNTVIAYAQPVYFVRDRALERFDVQQPFTLLIADTGVASPTKAAVEAVRRHWQTETARFEKLFDGCGRIASHARHLIETGQPELIGPLMTENHSILQAMSVSSQKLDALVAAAAQSGALGAKLSGGGRGGNMISLVTDSTQTAVRSALLTAGARRVIATQVGASTAGASMARP
jgi:mevalonate kinase